MLVRKFKIKDLKNYEDNNCQSILDMFNSMAISDLVQLVILGNTSINEEEACEILDTYLKEHDIVDAFSEIRYIMFGAQDAVEQELDEENVDTNETIALDKYQSITDMFQDICMNMMSVGLSYSEFWEMDTKEIWNVFASIYLKIQTEINRQLSLAHTQAAMIGSAVWGKLAKDAPQVDLTPILNNDNDEIETEFGIMTRGEYKIIEQLKSTRQVINYVNNGSEE